MRDAGGRQREREWEREKGQLNCISITWIEPNLQRNQSASQSLRRSLAASDLASAWQQTAEKALGNKVNVAPRTGPQQRTEGGWPTDCGSATK